MVWYAEVDGVAADAPASPRRVVGPSPGWGRRRRSCSPGWPANRRQGTRVQPQRVATVVESKGVGQLGVEEAYHMTPRAKRAGLGVCPGVPGQMRHKMSGNEIAELLQQRKVAARWLGVLHGRPSGRSTYCKPTSSSTRYPKLTKAVGQQ